MWFGVYLFCILDGLCVARIFVTISSLQLVDIFFPLYGRSGMVKLCSSSRHMLLVLAACMLLSADSFSAIFRQTVPAGRMLLRRIHPTVAMASDILPQSNAVVVRKQPQSLEDHAERLRMRGYTVIAEPIVNAAVVEQARLVTSSHCRYLPVFTLVLYHG